VLKIIKHCRESYPVDVTGQLLGLDVDGILEVTNCFPFPSSDDDEASGNVVAKSTLQNAQHLRIII
jgi:translation initiation factor 3 subunit H